MTPSTPDRFLDSLDLYLDAVHAIPLLSAWEEQALAQRLPEDQAAEHALIRAHLRLVVTIAKRFQDRGLPLLDLIQEGSLGLESAVKRFDWRRGYRLSTFARWPIQAAIQRALAQQVRTVRLPEHVLTKISRIRTAERKLLAALGREPTVLEIASVLTGLEPRAEAAWERDELHAACVEIASLKRHATLPLSLDTPVDPTGGAVLGDLITDTATPSPYEYCVAALDSHELEAALRSLQWRERRVIELRYGLAAEEPLTLAAIAAEVGVSRERVRQIETEVLGKLKSRLEGRLAAVA